MERAEWLKLMRSRAEALYDRFSYRYWDTWGMDVSDTHREYLQKNQDRIPPGGMILSAACGAGRFEGFLLEAGHSVVGIDQSEGVLAKAKEHFPKVQYKKMALQEMDFRETFEGVICMDAMEHICPEDYPGIFQAAGTPLPGWMLTRCVGMALSTPPMPICHLRRYGHRNSTFSLPGKVTSFWETVSV